MADHQPRKQQFVGAYLPLEIAKFVRADAQANARSMTAELLHIIQQFQNQKNGVDNGESKDNGGNRTRD